MPPEHGHNEDIESEVDGDNEDEVDVDLLTLLLLLHHRSVLGSLQGSHRAATVCLWITRWALQRWHHVRVYITAKSV